MAGGVSEKTQHAPTVVNIRETMAKKKKQREKLAELVLGSMC